jgi:hypothetical protein
MSQFQFKLGKLDAVFPVGLGALHTYATLPEASATWAGPDDTTWTYGMLGNDTYGDCTFAGYFHAIEVICLLLAVKPPSPTDPAVSAAYLAFTGGQDTGCVMANVLAAGFKTGFLGDKLAGYAPGRQGLSELWQITQYVGAGYIGVNLPAVAQQQFAADEPWDLTGTSADNDIEGGHCVVTVAFDQNAEMAEVLTWCPDNPTARKRQQVTFRWLEKYESEKWAMIPAQVETAGKLLDIDYAQLTADLKAL